MESKTCIHCRKTFIRGRGVTKGMWAARKFCSRQCAAWSRKLPSGTKDCVACGKTFHQPDSQRGKLWEDRKYCTTTCAYADRRGKRTGAEHWAWKGGRRVADGGYIEVAIPDEHPFAPMRRNHRYILEHRLVMAEHLGRPLGKHETVHHVNGDRQDNRVENLQLRSGRHGKGQALRCRSCGSVDIEHLEV